MKIKGKKILVTGGAGFIGSNLVDELAGNNHVVIVDNFSSGKRENIAHHEDNENVEIITGDIRDRELMKEVSANVDIIFHLAVQCLRVSIKDPEINHEVNATGTLNLCMAALENNISKFVYVSSSEVYGTAKYAPMDEEHPCDPITVYGASKLAGELYAMAYYRTYGLNSIIVRPFNTYGMREHFSGKHGEVIPRFVLRVLNEKPPVIFGDGAQTRDFTYVTDTVEGIIRASQCDDLIGQTVNIAKGEEISINKIAELIIEKLDKPHITPLYEKPRPGDVMRHSASVAKAEKTLSFKAETDIERGIEKYIEWFLSCGFDIKKLSVEEPVFNW